MYLLCLFDFYSLSLSLWVYVCVCMCGGWAGRLVSLLKEVHIWDTAWLLVKFLSAICALAYVYFDKEYYKKKYFLKTCTQWTVLLIPVSDLSRLVDRIVSYWFLGWGRKCIHENVLRLYIFNRKSCLLFSRYSAAAVILHIADCDVPYLCKIAVSAQAQVRCKQTGSLWLWVLFCIFS